MTPSSITTLYNLLIVAAESCGLQRRPHVGALSLDELADAIAARARGPSDGPRLIGDEEAMLAQCLLRIAGARLDRDAARERLWTQIVGVLLPVVREHFALAIAAHRNATIVTTDQDYVRR